jgi:hypothetical protein
MEKLLAHAQSMFFASKKILPNKFRQSKSWPANLDKCRSVPAKITFGLCDHPLFIAKLTRKLTLCLLA